MNGELPWDDHRAMNVIGCDCRYCSTDDEILTDYAAVWNPAEEPYTQEELKGMES